MQKYPDMESKEGERSLCSNEVMTLGKSALMNSNLSENGHIAKDEPKEGKLMNNLPATDNKLSKETDKFIESNLRKCDSMGSKDGKVAEKTFDDLLKYVGQFGRFQWFIFISLAMTSVAATWHNLIHVFTGAVPNFQCASAVDNIGANSSSGFIMRQLAINKTIGSDYVDSSNTTTVQCERSMGNTSSSDIHGAIPCASWTYDTTQYSSSIVTEWNLVCDDKWMISFVQSLHMLGCMLGGLLFGEISDRRGRRPVLLLTTVMTVVIGIGTAFMPTFELYALSRLLVGMTISGQFNAAYIIAIELVGPKWRAIAGILMLNLAALAIMVMAGLAFLVRDWRHLQLIISAPPALLMIYFLIAPESPRWLLVHRKTKEATQLIERLAKYNGKTLPHDYRNWLDQSGEIHKEAGPRYTALDLFRTQQIRLKTITLTTIWFGISVTYYGLSLYTSNLGGNDYINFFLSGAVEIPAYTCSIWCLRRFGRRNPLCISMAVSGCILILTSAFDDDRLIVRIVLSMCGKMCISVAFVIIYPFSVEIFPTVIRNNGLAVASAGARVGGFVAPYILMLGDISKVIPLVVCGVVSLLGGIMAVMLPETGNMKLPETIEDAEKIKHNSFTEVFMNLFRKSSKTKDTTDALDIIDTKNIGEIEILLEKGSNSFPRTGGEDYQNDTSTDSDSITVNSDDSCALNSTAFCCQPCNDIVDTGSKSIVHA